MENTSPIVLKVGDKAKAMWKFGRKWYQVTVDSVNEDGTYGLTYEDGDVCSNVSIDRMRLLDDTPLSINEVILEKEKLKHSCALQAIDVEYLKELSPKIINIFKPQIVSFI